ncbi:MAG: ThiF family adenylyltransferase [Anaerolineae bacterium]|nr:ThiF family adenylyltransferase [Anaerolineae bacterium]
MNWDRVVRVLGAETLAYLKHRKVAVIGMGSGGGFVALGLAMSGVGNFVLMDDDLLEVPNLVRHVADRRDLGRPKVQAVADLIRHRNPEADITAIEGRVESHADWLEDVDLVICAVDGEGTKFQINELCLTRQLPAIYAGVYERGEGGDVVMIYPNVGPCYACWAANLRDGAQSTAPDGSVELD